MNGNVSTDDPAITDLWRPETYKPNGTFLSSAARPPLPQQMVYVLDTLEQARDWVGMAATNLRSMVVAGDFHTASPIPPAPPVARTQGIADVAAERARQIDDEGYTAERDDGNTVEQLAYAGVAYALFAAGDTTEALGFWPRHWSKPKLRDGRRNLVRAAALIIAAIDRHDRAVARAAEVKAQQKIEEPPPAPKRATYSYTFADGPGGPTIYDLPAPVSVEDTRVRPNGTAGPTWFSKLMLKDGSVWTYHHATGVLTEVIPA